MARLPQPGSDDGQWGEILNEYLSESLSSDGSIKPGAVSKADVGLGNVDNTSDANKPVSTATQTALDQKVATTALDGLMASRVQDTQSQTATAISEVITMSLENLPVQGHAFVLAPWSRVLQQTPAAAKLALVGDSTYDSAANGVGLHNALKALIASGGYLEGMQETNVLNFGVNGGTTEVITSSERMQALAAAAPHLIIAGPGINNIKSRVLTDHDTDVAWLRSILVAGFNALRVACPGVPIIASIPNSFLTADTNGSNYVTMVILKSALLFYAMLIYP